MTTRSPLQGNTKGFLRAAFFPFLAGFLLQFNFQPRAFGIPVDRVSILLQSGLVVILMLLLLNRRVGGRGVAFLVGAFLLFAANIMANGADLAFGYGNVDLSISVTYALSLVAAVPLLWALREQVCVEAFCWGVVLGGAGGAVVAVMQTFGLSPLLTSFGLVPAGQTVQVVGGLLGSRQGGMWGHANELGHVVAMTVPAGLALTSTGRGRIALPLAILSNLAVFYVAGNRGGIVSASVTIVAALYFGGGLRLAVGRFMVASLTILAAIPLILIFLNSDNLLYQRFASDGNIDNNIAGRLSSTAYGVKLALTHPFGLGWNEWHAALRADTGISSTHNGFISVAFAFGALFCALFILALVKQVSISPVVKDKAPIDTLLFYSSIGIAISMLFEQLGYSIPFIFMACLITARFILGGGGSHPHNAGHRFRPTSAT